MTTLCAPFSGEKMLTKNANMQTADKHREGTNNDTHVFLSTQLMNHECELSQKTKPML